MSYRFRQWLFPHKQLHYPFTPDQLGCFAQVSGSFWQCEKKQLTNYKVIGRIDLSCDRYVIACGRVAQAFGRFFFKAAEMWDWRYIYLWRMGFIDPPEGVRINLRKDFRFAFWRVLRNRP